MTDTVTEDEATVREALEHQLWPDEQSFGLAKVAASFAAFMRITLELHRLEKECSRLQAELHIARQVTA